MRDQPTKIWYINEALENVENALLFYSIINDDPDGIAQDLRSAGSSLLDALAKATDFSE